MERSLNSDPCRVYCKACSSLLFDTSLVLESHRSFHEGSEFETNGASRPICSNLALQENCIEILKPDGTYDELRGTFSCPKCSLKIGRYCLWGQECACGEFICPAFFIARKKIDIVNL